MKDIVESYGRLRLERKLQNEEEITAMSFTHSHHISLEILTAFSDNSILLSFSYLLIVINIIY